MTEPRQLALDLPCREALGREDFLVSRSNRLAVDLIDAYPNWPHSEVLLVGPEGSGKSHLVEVWRAMSGAARVAAATLDTSGAPPVQDGSALAVEDCDRGGDEVALFHLLNDMSRAGGNLLLTARKPPAEWGVALADLRSRLGRMAMVTLEPPDDALIEALLVKLFADRQLDVAPSVIRYLALRLERSFSALRRAVERLDRMAIEEQRGVTRAMAARMLAEIGPEGQD